MTDRELLQQALDTLRHLCLHSRAVQGYDGEQVQSGIEALKARLAQPENEFNPDWDAMSAMVEEQQRMSKRIEELEAALAQPEQEPVATVYDAYDTTGIDWHCKDAPSTGTKLYTAPPQLDVPETAFGKMPETINMKNFVGSEKPLVPVCWMNANDIDKTDWKVWAHGKPTVSMPLFTVPPQREWVGLTKEEYEAMAEKCVTNCYFDTLKYARAIEAKLRSKNS